VSHDSVSGCATRRCDAIAGGGCNLRPLMIANYGPAGRERQGEVKTKWLRVNLLMDEGRGGCFLAISQRVAGAWPVPFGLSELRVSPKRFLDTPAQRPRCLDFGSFSRVSSSPPQISITAATGWSPSWSTFTGDDGGLVQLRIRGFPGRVSASVGGYTLPWLHFHNNQIIGHEQEWTCFTVGGSSSQDLGVMRLVLACPWADMLTRHQLKLSVQRSQICDERFDMCAEHFSFPQIALLLPTRQG
jgi:hypothetical protein